MKCWQFSLISATFLIKNAESVGQSGERPKLHKTFDEIFGKDWDAEVPEFTETKEWHKMETQTTEVENKSTDQPNPNEQSFSDHYESFANRKIKERFDEIYDENWSEDDNEFIEEDEADSTDQNLADDLDQDNSKKHLSDQNNSTDQEESVDGQQNESNKCEKIESDQQKWEIIQKFREIKKEYTKKRKYSRKQHIQIENKISNGLGVGRTKLYKWIKEFDLRKETKSKFSESEKREIVKQFEKIKSKCKQAKFNISMRKLDEKIAKKFAVGASAIIRWKRKFGLSVSNKFSDATKIRIMKKYAKIKGKNPKMSDCDIAVLLNIARPTLAGWKAKFMGIVNDKHAEEAESTDHDDDVDE